MYMFMRAWCCPGTISAGPGGARSCRRRGEGLELLLTLGTGLGTAVFLDGSPTPHLELALMPFRGRGTFQDQLGDRARSRIGNRRWSKRVLAAVEMFDALLHIDRLYVGGGNAKKLTRDLGHRVQLVDNVSGILGGIKLWELDERKTCADSPPGPARRPAISVPVPHGPCIRSTGPRRGRLPPSAVTATFSVPRERGLAASGPDVSPCISVATTWRTTSSAAFGRAQR
jgi:hypothetical protein